MTVKRGVGALGMLGGPRSLLHGPWTPRPGAGMHSISRCCHRPTRDRESSRLPAPRRAALTGHSVDRAPTHCCRTYPQTRRLPPRADANPSPSHADERARLAAPSRSATLSSMAADDLAGVRDWFAERGFGIQFTEDQGGPAGPFVWADLMSLPSGRVVAPMYGRGQTDAEAARSARRRFEVEQ